MDMVENDFISIKEFAVKVGAHPNTIRRAIKKGRISACDIGSGGKRIYRIAKSEIDRIALFNLKNIIDKLVEEKLLASEFNEFSKQTALAQKIMQKNQNVLKKLAQ
jgi:excisionase family DNA binding protein